MAPKHTNRTMEEIIATSEDESSVPPPPPPPLRMNNNKASNAIDLYYSIRSPWAWVFREVANYHSNIATKQQQPQSGGCTIKSFVEIDDGQSNMPSSIILKEFEQNNIATPLTPSQRRRKVPQECTLRLDIINSSYNNNSKNNNTNGDAAQNNNQEDQSDNNNNNEVITMNRYRYGIHGTSTAFDGLEDKDELVRTLQRCRCEHLNLSPPSILLGWDVTKEECRNVIGSRLPSLKASSTDGTATKNKVAESNNNSNGSSANNQTEVAVLKEPMGSSGTGIHFVSSYEEIHDIMQDHKKRAIDEKPEFFDDIIDKKGRIPSWVLQAEIHPPLLICERRKFHIRTYVCVIENLYNDDNISDVYIYNRHEVRIASHPVDDDNSNDASDACNNNSQSLRRDRRSHITDGKVSERLLLSDVPELAERNMQSKVERFVSELFGKHLVPDMDRRVIISAKKDAVSYPNISDDNDHVIPNKFGFAGLDIMATDDGRLYLLEANVNPTAPPEMALEEEGCSKFRNHLIGFLADLITLTTTQTSMALYDNKTTSNGLTIHSPPITPDSGHSNNTSPSNNNWVKARDVLKQFHNFL